MDITPRYVPDETLVITPLGGRTLPVIGVRAFPPGTHPESCPIRADVTAVEMQTTGRSSWWGFERAWINSELRMVVSGFSEHCELRRKWEVCREV